ncbi:hypothetical protein IB234_22995 [Pseudomonas sp. PDM16]|uniref:hypothetical protein n=1 Tax=Pseudomonas sp. PDM16 TaxID=2769292 RepID=UPI0017808AFD|nr:hypothetical protein [Pseudomonas sp. PDM16]MBD9417441.1 hypothetical protein [Pseudomonas sp. PDM16]
MREKAGHQAGLFVCVPRDFSCHRLVMGNLQAVGMVFVSAKRNDRETTGETPMDDYVEELLESRAIEQDPVEPAEDATEL